MKKRLITYGTFDLFHIGHLNLLKRMKSMGDELIVAVSTDEFNAQKGKSSVICYQDRSEILRSIRYVDFVIPETAWEQKKNDIKNYGVSIFAMGADWKGKFDFLADICEVRYLPRTEGVSTTKIKSGFGFLNVHDVEDLKKSIDLAVSIVEKLK